MVKGINWFKGSICSIGPRVYLVQGFNWFKASTDSRLHLVQVFGQHSWTWAWHSSAPACIVHLLKYIMKVLCNLITVAKFPDSISNLLFNGKKLYNFWLLEQDFWKCSNFEQIKRQFYRNMKFISIYMFVKLVWFASKYPTPALYIFDWERKEEEKIMKERREKKGRNEKR